jgi:tripartite-type tricarboxylate transporter receptor subunit TctC
MNKSFLTAATVLVAIPLMGTTFSDAAFAEYPTKNIKVVVHTGPGSGSDMFARNVVKMLNNQKKFKKRFVVVNKPGGRGAIAVKYLSTRTGDAHTIMNMADSGFLNVPIMSGLDLKLSDFTPLAILGFDVNVIAVLTKSKYKTLKQLVKAAKAKPKTVSSGVGTIGGSAHILGYLVSDDTFNFVGFKGGGKAMTAFLGGHVDISGENISELISFAKSGKVRILGIGSNERIAALPDAPTTKEAGFNHQIGLGRGFVAPGNFPDDAKKTIVNLLKEVRKTKDWKKFVADNVFQDQLITGSKLDTFLLKKQKIYHSFIHKFGLAKKK